MCVKYIVSLLIEDLLDWHHIMTLYDKALDRRQLYEKFKEREPQFPREDLMTSSSGCSHVEKRPILTYFEIPSVLNRFRNIQISVRGKVFIYISFQTICITTNIICIKMENLGIYLRTSPVIH